MASSVSGVFVVVSSTVLSLGGWEFLGSSTALSSGGWESLGSSVCGGLVVSLVFLSMVNGWWYGSSLMYFRKNFLFLNVHRPELSILIPYWSNCFTSMTVPVLSHLFGCGPVWFCTNTLSPTCSACSRFVCSYSLGWGELRCCLRTSWCLADVSSRLSGILMFMLGR